jgi:hypothetical protein
LERRRLVTGLLVLEAGRLWLEACRLGIQLGQKLAASRLGLRSLNSWHVGEAGSVFRGLRGRLLICNTEGDDVDHARNLVCNSFR